MAYFDGANGPVGRVGTEDAAPTFGGEITNIFSSVTFEDTSAEVSAPRAAAPEAEVVAFRKAEKPMNCFTPGTMIATPRGEVAIEKLSVGDRVITRDNGLQAIRWIGTRTVSRDDLARARHLAPIRISKGALGNDLPERDLTVSPNHRVLVANDKTALYFEDTEVLVAAKHLTGLPGVDVVEDEETTYIHLTFDQHEIVLTDGCWTESFQPSLKSGEVGGNAQRTEVVELFPTLSKRPGVQTASEDRRGAKPQDAALMLK